MDWTSDSEHYSGSYTPLRSWTLSLRQRAKIHRNLSTVSKGSFYPLLHLQIQQHGSCQSFDSSSVLTSFHDSDPPVSLLVVTWSHPDRPEESHIKVLTSKSHHVCKVPFAIAGNTFWGCEGSHYSANHTNSGQLTRHNNDDEVDIDDGDDKDGAMMMKMVMLIKMVL